MVGGSHVILNGSIQVPGGHFSRGRGLDGGSN